jgi:hypothetical protein
MGRRNKNRNRIPRKSYRSIFILCEGKTEETYIKLLAEALNRDRQRAVKIQAETNNPHTDALSLAKRAIEEATEAMPPHEVVWLFFDHDEDTKLKAAFRKIETFNKKQKRKKSCEVKLAFTDFCTEYWFLLHFEKTGKQFKSGKEVLDALKKHLPNYKKGKLSDVIEALKERQADAMANAEALFKGKKALENRPFSSVPDLLKFLEEEENKAK